MGIEFLSGEVNSEQYIVPPSMRLKELRALKDGENNFIAHTCMWMDESGALWLDGLATPLKDFIPATEDTHIRVIKLPEGFVVDISHALDDFRSDLTGEVTFSAQIAPETVNSAFDYKKVPVIGLLQSQGEVEAFRQLIADRYGYSYPDPIRHPQV